MKIRILVGVLVLLILVNLGTIGTYLYLHFTHRPEPPALDGGPRPPLAALSPEQREKLGDLMEGFRRETRDLNEQARMLEDSTVALLERNPVPDDLVDAQLKQLADLRLEISKKAARKLALAKSFLSADQQQGFFMSVMKARPAFPGGPPPPPGAGMPPGRHEGEMMPPPPPEGRR